MASKITLVLCSLALLMQLVRVSAIRCYECSASDNKYCAEPPDTGSLQVVECGPASDVCAKLILTVFDKTIVSRSCANTEYCQHVDDAIGVCSLCLTDGCNSSTILRSSSVLLMLSIALGVAEVARRIFAV